MFYNINFPPVPAAQVRDVVATVQGERGGSPFGLSPQEAPNGRRYLWIQHGLGNQTCAPGSDAREASEGRITVTPLRADLTARDLVDGLGEILV